MSKKRKSDATSLDEVDRSMYTTFCIAANSLSQLYSQAINHQRISFQAGETFSMDFEAARRRIKGATADIVANLQNELECGAEESPISPRLSFQHHQTATQLNSLSASFSATLTSPATTMQGVRSGDNPAKNSLFSNALSSPVRQSLLQHYHSVQGSCHSNNAVPPASGARDNETNCTHQQSRLANSPNANDCMDMHADSRAHDFPF